MRLSRQLDSVPKQTKKGKTMTMGIFVNGRRPKSKKEVKEIAASDPSNVYVEATSIFGNEKSGTLDKLPNGTYTFVGPDPYTKRNFYGNIVKTNDKIVVK